MLYVEPYKKRHLSQSTFPNVKEIKIYNVFLVLPQALTKDKPSIYYHSPLEFGKAGRPSCPLQRRAQSLFSSCGPGTRIIKTNSDGGNNDDNEKDNDDDVLKCFMTCKLSYLMQSELINDTFRIIDLFVQLHFSITSSFN